MEIISMSKYPLNYTSKNNSYAFQLNQKLDNMFFYLLYKANEIKRNFMTDFAEVDNWSLLLECIVESESWLEKKGASTVSVIKNSLKSKIITQKNFEYLNKVLDNELITAKDLLSENITLVNLKIFLNYIIECLIYVKYDLEIDELLSVSKKEIILNMVSVTTNDLNMNMDMDMYRKTA